jgi:Rap1a immunity proteins
MMMMIIRRTLFAGAIAALVFGTISCLAAEKTSPGLGRMSGNQLYSDCESLTSLDQGICVGYTTAVFDTLQTLRQRAHLPSCAPMGVTVEQVHDVVMKFLQEHPADLNYSADSLAQYAIIAAWCPSHS